MLGDEAAAGAYEDNSRHGGPAENRSDAGFRLDAVFEESFENFKAGVSATRARLVCTSVL
jgi:hypothetical protein